MLLGRFSRARRHCEVVHTSRILPANLDVKLELRTEALLFLPLWRSLLCVLEPGCVLALGFLHTSSGKDLRAFDRVTAELLFLKAGSLVHLFQHLHDFVCREALLGPRSILIQPYEPLTRNVERHFLAVGTMVALTTTSTTEQSCNEPSQNKLVWVTTECSVPMKPAVSSDEEKTTKCKKEGRSL